MMEAKIGCIGLTILLSCFGGKGVGAQEKSIEIVPRWQKGEKHHYVRTKARLKKRGERILSNSKGHTDVAIEVLAAGKDGHILGWTFGETKYDDPRVANNALLKRMNNLVKGIRFELKLLPNGEFEKVNNIGELKKKFSEVIDFLIDELGEKNGLSKSKKDQLRTAMRSMFLSKNGIEQITAKEPRAFLMALGQEYPFSKAVVAKTELPLPGGKVRVKAQCEYKLRSYDPKTKLAVIAYSQTIDPKEGKRAVEQFLKELAQKSGIDVPAGDPLQNLSISDTAEIVINTETGWPQRVSYTRTVRTFGVLLRDVITIVEKQ